jgi:hypothetical protein
VPAGDLQGEERHRPDSDQKPALPASGGQLLLRERRWAPNVDAMDATVSSWTG